MGVRGPWSSKLADAAAWTARRRGWLVSGLVGLAAGFALGVLVVRDADHAPSSDQGDVTQITPEPVAPPDQGDVVPITPTTVRQKPKVYPLFRYSEADVIRLVGLRDVPGSGRGGSGDTERWTTRDGCEVEGIVRGRKVARLARADQAQDAYPGHVFPTNPARDVGLQIASQTTAAKYSERERCYRSLTILLRRVE